MAQATTVAVIGEWRDLVNTLAAVRPSASSAEVKAEAVRRFPAQYRRFLAARVAEVNGRVRDLAMPRSKAVYELSKADPELLRDYVDAQRRGLA